MRSALVVSGFLVACSSPGPAPSGPGSASGADPAAAITRPRIVAHRGASAEAPENTLAAFRHAWALGVEAVELDVRLTSDGAVVVFHDETTRRIGGVDRAVADQTLAELQALDAGAWFSSAFTGEPIPTLAEVLASVPRGATVVVEIKSPIATVPAVAAAIRAGDPEPRGGHVALQAYDAEALAALAHALPGVPAYWTVNPPTGEVGELRPYPPALIADAKARGFAGLALDYRGVEPDFIAAVRAAGLELDVWTLNDAALLTEWLARDVRFLETDQPALVPIAPAAPAR